MRCNSSADAPSKYADPKTCSGNTTQPAPSAHIQCRTYMGKVVVEPAPIEHDGVVVVVGTQQVLQCPITLLGRSLVLRDAYAGEC